MTPLCPNCNQPVPAPKGVQTHTSRRPGGRQTSFERTVRHVAWALLDEGYVSTEQAAELKARRWLSRALPEKQKAPRKLPADLREAA